MLALPPDQLAFVTERHLATLSTLRPDGSPHVVPVGFRLGREENAIEVGGHAIRGSKKWRDLEADARVAVVIDDLEQVNPWTPRGLEIRGRAELREEGGESFGAGWDAAWIRIVPQRIVSWGIEGHAFTAAGRRTARSVAGG